MDCEVIDGIGMYYYATKRGAMAEGTRKAPAILNGHTEDPNVEWEMYAQQHFMVGYSLGKSTDEHIGMFPSSARKGDPICVLFGGHIPFVLRHFEGTHHHYIGECYMHGWMDGEAMVRLEEGKFGKETFTIR